MAKTASYCEITNERAEERGKLYESTNAKANETTADF
jgi:hypothetical protein